MQPILYEKKLLKPLDAEESINTHDEAPIEEQTDKQVVESNEDDGAPEIPEEDMAQTVSSKHSYLS